MVNRTTILAAVVALIPVGNPMLASAQAPGRQAATPRTTNPNLYPPADYTLKVTSNSRLPELQAKYHRKVRDLLNQARIGVPDDRVRHFRTVLSPNSAPVSGWHGEIYSIAPVEEGIVVEIMIRANQGGGEANTTFLMERYSIVYGKIQYLGSYVPKNAAGFSVTF